MASSILVTTSIKIADETIKELTKQLKKLSRKEIAEKSLKDYGAVILVNNLDEAAAIVNEIAPEHLELSVDRPFELLPKIKNAGAIFLGHYTPEAVGDYLAGPNHTLPTGGDRQVLLSPFCNGLSEEVEHPLLLGGLFEKNRR